MKERDPNWRRKADDDLFDNLENFRLLYESMPLGYESLDSDGNILIVNQAWLDLLGYSEKEEVIGKNLEDFITKKELFAEWFPKFKDCGLTSEALFEMVKKDGSTILVSTDGRVSYDKDGNFINTHCVLHDITKRKKVEEALIKSEEKFRSLSENSIDYIMRYDDQNRHIYVNEACARVAGIPATDFIGKTHRELGFDEEQINTWEEKIQKVFETAEPQQYEFMFEGAEGPVYLDWRVMPEFSPTGEVESALGISRDITERKQSEEEIKSISRFLLENPNPVVRIDNTHKILYRNPAFVKLLKVVGLLEEDTFKILPDKIEVLVDQVLNTEQAIHFSVVNVGDKVISYNIIPVVEQGYVNLYGRDITEKQKAEDELKTRTEELERINKAFVGRELRMMELKEEIKELKKNK